MMDDPAKLKGRLLRDTVDLFAGRLEEIIFDLLMTHRDLAAARAYLAASRRHTVNAVKNAGSDDHPPDDTELQIIGTAVELLEDSFDRMDRTCCQTLNLRDMLDSCSSFDCRPAAATKYFLAGQTIQDLSAKTRRKF
jgi:hypothetical protein